MPAPLPWTTLANGISKADASLLLDTFKSFKVSKSELVPCKICAFAAPHNMRRRILVCISKPCKDLEPLARCVWRCRTLTCQVMDLVCIAELKTHASPLDATLKPRLTEEMKDVARALTEQGLKPARIRNAFLTRFNLDETSLPALPTVQRFTQHYARTSLGGTDDHDDVDNQVADLAHKPGQPDTEAFTFTWEYEADGKPHVGKGSDGDPFIVGMTSARLLKRVASWDPSTFVVHADATFKLNQVGYPVFVVGVSDLARSFHLLALFVTSQRRESDYVKMLAALKNVYYRVTGLRFSIRYSMADADDAQLSATRAVFAAESGVTSLMCYYHVTAKVYERTRSLNTALAALVTEGVADMHFSRSALEFQQTQERVLAGWAAWPGLQTFRDYFTPMVNGTVRKLASIPYPARFCHDQQSRGAVQPDSQVGVHPFTHVSKWELSLASSAFAVVPKVCLPSRSWCYQRHLHLYGVECVSCVDPRTGSSGLYRGRASNFF